MPHAWVADMWARSIALHGGKRLRLGWKRPQSFMQTAFFGHATPRSFLFPIPTQDWVPARAAREGTAKPR